MPFKQAPLNPHRKLIAKYVHSGNLVLQPTAIDMTTGIITFGSNHGLAVNDLLMLAFNSDVNPNYCPNEWFATSPADYLQVTSIPASNQIIVKNANVTNPYTSYAAKSTVDMSKIHFEKFTAGAIIINGFSTTKLYIYLDISTGKGDCYSTLPDIAGYSWQSVNIAYFAHGLAFSSNANHSLYRHLRGEAIFHVTPEGRANVYVDARQYLTTGTNGALQDKSPGVGWGSVISAVSAKAITSITINGESGITQPLLNGSTYELYDLS